jgi:hypothetical protein
VRRPEYDTSDTYWASAGPRILSYTWLAHCNTGIPKKATKSITCHHTRLLFAVLSFRPFRGAILAQQQDNYPKSSRHSQQPRCIPAIPAYSTLLQPFKDLSSTVGEGTSSQIVSQQLLRSAQGSWQQLTQKVETPRPQNQPLCQFQEVATQCIVFGQCWHLTYQPRPCAARSWSRTLL